MPNVLFILTHCLLNLNCLRQQWESTYNWNLSSWKTRTPLYYIFDIMPTDDLDTQGARASAAMVLTWFIQNIPVSNTRILTPSIVKKLPDFSIHNLKNTERYFMRFPFHENGLAPWLCNSRLYHYVGLDLRFSTVKLCKPWLSQPRIVHVLQWGEWEYCYWLWFVFSLQGHIDAWTLYPTFSWHF